MKKLLFSLTLLLLAMLLSCSSPLWNGNNTSAQNDQEQFALPFYGDATFTPVWAGESTNLPGDFHTIPDFAFTNQQGKTISQETVRGKIFVANFFFTTCPGICPKMMDNLLLVQDRFGENEQVLLLSHSVTPWSDDPGTLSNYADHKGIVSPNWHLLTGEKEEIYAQARKGYFAEETPGLTKNADQFLHTEHFILVDGQGFIRGIYNGTLELETERMMEDIAVLLSRTA